MDILVVDPDTGLQEYYKHLLESEFRNIKVHFRTSGQDALQYLPAHPSDVVLTETRIGMDFFEFISELGKRGVPSIVISSESSERLIVECMRAGALDFVAKNNIKLGHLPYVIARALLEADRWTRVLKYSAEIEHRPEYRKLDSRVRDYLRAERMEQRRKEISSGKVQEGHYIEGEAYFVIYLYLELKIPESVAQTLDERRFSALQSRLLDNFCSIPTRYGGQQWTRKENAAFFAFGAEDQLAALLSAIEIRASLRIFNMTLENLPDALHMNIGLAGGQTVYREEKSEIYSEALNLAAHMAIYSQERNSILLTSQIHEQLSMRARKYLFKLDQPFEGHTTYRFEQVA